MCTWRSTRTSRPTSSESRAGYIPGIQARSCPRERYLARILDPHHRSRRPVPGRGGRTAVAAGHGAVEHRRVTRSTTTLPIAVERIARDDAWQIDSAADDAELRRLPSRQTVVPGVRLVVLGKQGAGKVNSVWCACRYPLCGPAHLHVGRHAAVRCRRRAPPWAIKVREVTMDRTASFSADDLIIADGFVERLAEPDARARRLHPRRLPPHHASARDAVAASLATRMPPT